MDNIIENNKLIAEFLEWEFDDLSETFETPFLKLVDSHAFGDEQFSCKLQDFELEFHTDWNWLMKLVEKILQKCAEMDELEKYWEITDVMPYIDNVYSACVEFVKWYNEQNK